jgi:hypothetical protein
MEKAFKVINEMSKKGILTDYAICGAVATIYYTEPFDTYDVDIFFIPPEKEKMIILTPFYDWLLKEKKYKAHKEYILIGETPVQFVPTATFLEEEAVKNAVEVVYKEMKLKILRPEYLIAVFLKVYRLKDKVKIKKLLDETEINRNLLMEILTKYNLKEKFQDFMEKYYE